MRIRLSVTCLLLFSTVAVSAHPIESNITESAEIHAGG